MIKIIDGVGGTTYNTVCDSGYPSSLTGNVEEALPHFINFIHFSGNPNATLMTLQQSMPAPLFNLIYQAYMAMKVQGMKTAAAGGGAGVKTAKKDEPEVD